MIKVLIVEDDPMVIKFNTHYLEQVEGFKLTAVARSAEDALDILKSKKIDLILLDIYMPGINGLELLSKLRKMDKSVDVMVVSAAKDSLSIKKALQYGAADYLIKPFEFERFKAALERYLKGENLIRIQDDLSQEDLDKHFLIRQQESSEVHIPKGLDKNTLRLTWENLLTLPDNYYSTEEIAQFVGISRISMRKYIFFLQEFGALKKDIVYGSPGRPIYKYKRNNDSSLLNQFFD